LIAGEKLSENVNVEWKRKLEIRAKEKAALAKEVCTIKFLIILILFS
jgi:hypothetical protein